VPAFDAELQQRLDAIRADGLYRQLRRVDSAQGRRLQIDGHTLLNFSSNDYLGLASHPKLKETAKEAAEKFGAGSGASRLICGSLAVHHDLELALAMFKNVPAAISFTSGYAAAIGTITALVGKDDVIVLDKLVHASIVDAAKLSGAKLRVFTHNDLNDLEDILKWADRLLNSDFGVREKKPHVLIVTESVFSMDGDYAPLREIVSLKEKYGAWLMVDEAHATGLYGKNRRGLAEAMGVSDNVEIQMGTLGKAIGASGGYICGSRALIDFLVNRARSFIFSTAPVPAAAAAAMAGIGIIESEEGQTRCQQLRERIAQFRSKVPDAPADFSSAIIPIIVGDEAAAVSAATHLRERGIFVPAIRYPTVARGSARLRVTLTAAHTEADVGVLKSVVSEIQNLTFVV
jgi:8-amino-7-oxononanoate synthase